MYSFKSLFSSTHLKELTMDDSLQNEPVQKSHFFFHKKFILIAAYFACTPILLLFVILYSLYLVHEKEGSDASVIQAFNKSAHYQALPSNPSTQNTQTLETIDARERLLAEFLTKYRSPLVPHTKYLIEVADNYNLDYRLLPAIAMQESNLCKKIPKNSDYNCWGFGIYGNKRTGFDSYEHAIDTVAKTLAQKYVDKGLDEPHEIMSRYTPGSNGSWAESVNYFMNKIHEEL